MSPLTLDEILSLVESLYGAPASITVTALRVKLSTPGAPDRVNCARAATTRADEARAALNRLRAATHEAAEMRSAT